MHCTIVVAIVAAVLCAPRASGAQGREGRARLAARAASALEDEAEALGVAEAIAREEAASRSREEAAPDREGPAGWFSLKRLFGGGQGHGTPAGSPHGAFAPLTIRETASLPRAAPFPLPASAESGADEGGGGRAGMLLGDARDLAEVGDRDGALAVLTALLARVPDSAEALRTRAGLRLAQGEYGAAVDDYRRAVAIGGGDLEAHYGLGTSLEKWAEKLEAEGAGNKAAEKYRDAAIEYKTVLWARPDYPPACYSLGCVYARMDKRDDALHYFRKTLERVEKDSELARRVRYNMKLMGER